MADPWAKYRDDTEGDAWTKYRDEPKRPNATFDFFRSIVPGAQKGVAAMVGARGDAADQLTEMVLNGLAPFGVKPTQEQRAAVKVGAAEMLAGRMPFSIPQLVGVMAGHGLSTKGADIQARAGALGSPQINAAREATLGPYYHPKTEAGRVGEAIGAALPTMPLVPGGPTAKIAQTVIPAATGELSRYGAEQAGFGPTGQQIAQLAGGVTGGALSSLVGRQPVAQARMGNALSTFNEQDIANARTLVQRAEAQGIRLGMDEALAQVAPDRATPMQNLVRATGKTPRGAEALTEATAGRMGQIDNAVTGFADRLAPPPPDPYQLGLRVKDAADEALNAERQAINARAQPHYDALRSQSLPDEAFQLFAQHPTYQRAQTALFGNDELATLIRDPQTGQPLPPNNLATINNVVQQIDSLAENARPNPMNPAANQALTSVREGARAGADDVVRTSDFFGFTPGDWTAARDIVSQGRAATYEPMLSGPLGTLRKQTSIGDQASTLFPKNPTEGYGAATATALERLGVQNPELPPALTRARFMDEYNTTSRPLIGGPSPTAGAKFAVALTGNPEQGAIFRSAVESVAPDSVSQYDDLIDALRATGTRKFEGSPTAGDTRELQNLQAGELPVESAKALAQPYRIPARIGDWLEEMQLNRNARSIVRALTDVDNFETFAGRAMRDRGNTYARELARTLAATFGSMQPAELERQEEERRKKARAD